ncbi:hypothetical protein NQ315_010676 [Exocentrus adspersus]|uniref:Uncharacterized protein n=1 Tax=Exocentrus adspersus TaxID=1586481 RepID=A0AAV8VUD4_9CUCU|nr:hypothetical protein NQ315_010676 [Exocentrus adspersus]
MSYNQNYGYSTNPNYYMGAPEDFIPDYSDNEALSSEQHQILQGGHPNLTEIFSRNDTGAPQRQMATCQGRYLQNHQGQYMQQQCYYENPQPPQVRRLSVQQDYTQSYDPRFHQYCPLANSSRQDTNYEAMAYRSALQSVNAATLQPTHVRNYQEAMHQPSASAVQKQQSVKRYPVKVGTPKYYRKVASSGIYKRPSALCLPVASQPDPAAHKKHKKPASEIQYSCTQDPDPDQLLGKQSEPALTDHKVGSEGDFNLKTSKLDDMFDKIENENEELKAQSKRDITKFAKFLKPRVPASIKSQQETMKLKLLKQDGVDDKSASEEGKGGDETATSDTAGDSIEKLLNQLKKCELATNNDSANNLNIQTSEIENIAENTVYEDKNSSSRPKSFNYHDITNQMRKSKTEVKSFARDKDNERASVHDLRRLNLSMTTSRSFISKPPLDDHCALELHRSKSYIVNLIDKALSKELGTVPSNRSYREFNDMNPRKAIDLVNKHSCGKSDKELCLEITSALTDSIISNATVPEVSEIHRIPASSSAGKVCCCNSEEPTYIKQLKQLRWGHLKHIQREVRRLEDLERFLDSCSLNPISEI